MSKWTDQDWRSAVAYVLGKYPDDDEESPLDTVARVFQQGKIAGRAQAGEVPAHCASMSSSILESRFRGILAPRWVTSVSTTEVRE